MSPAWESLLPQANQQRINTLADYSWPDPMQNAMTTLRAADMLDQRQSRQYQNRIAKMQVESSEGHMEGMKKLPALIGKGQPGDEIIYTDLGPVGSSVFSAAFKDNPAFVSEQMGKSTAYKLGIATETRKAGATFAGRLAPADPEAAVNVMRGAGYPLSGYEGSTPGPANQAPVPAPATVNALTPNQPAGRIVIDQGGNKGMTTIQELQSTPVGRNLLSGMNMGTGATAAGTPQAAPLIPPGGQPTPATASSPLPTGQRLSNDQARAWISKIQDDPNTTPAKKIAQLGQILPLVSGTRLRQQINDARTAIYQSSRVDLSQEGSPYKDFRAGYIKEHPNASPLQISKAWGDEQIRISGTKAEKTQDLKSKDIDIASLAKAVKEGHDARKAIKGSMGNPVASKVESEVLKEYPHFDFGLSDANYNWKQSATNLRTINFAGGALPRLSRLDDQLSAMPNVNLNTINRLMRAVLVETGRPEYTNYESNRNAIVQEINTALSGTSQSSDIRLKIELENLKSARSPAQIRGAISNLREALIARLDVDLSPLYPIEVVRGEKTLQQYKDEMFKKYRGNYGTSSESGTTTGAPGGPSGGVPVTNFKPAGG